MSLNDLFRGLFFGRPRQNIRGSRLDEEHDADDEKDPFFGDHFFGGHREDEGGGIAFSSHFTEAEELMSHFDEMCRNFHELFQGMDIADFPQHRHGVPGIGAAPPPPSGEDPKALRDHMLKVPDSGSSGYTERPAQRPSEHGQPTQRPFYRFGGWDFPGLLGRQLPPAEERIDSDLDDYIKNGGSLSKILPPANSPHSQQMEPAPPPRSLFRGVSVHTYRSADGKVEERKTVEDSEGSETVVTRSIGDQSHSVTTKTEKDGTIHVSEKFQNMEKKDRPAFDSYWKSPAISSKKLPGDMNDTSFFNDFFSINFPGFGSSR